MVDQGYIGDRFEHDKLYPEQWQGSHLQSIVQNGNGIIVNINGVQVDNSLYYQETPADADEFEQYLALRKGTYTFKVIGATNNNMGIIDWKLDDVNFEAGQDWYTSPPITTNVIKTSAGIVIAKSGYHKLTGKVNGQNASSTNYYIQLTRFWLFRTGA